MLSCRKETKVKKRRSDEKNILLLFAAIVLTGMLMLLFLKSTADRGEYNDIGGEVEIFNGSEYLSILPQEGVPVNGLTEGDFALDEDGQPVYKGNEYETLKGIDVSKFQGETDWDKVRESGIDFAIIRAGGRAYRPEGELYSDDKLLENIDAAKEAGLKVGVYFFSQATTVKEAQTEANFVSDILNGRELDLPVFFDWERIGTAPARTDGLDGKTLTDCAVAFCERIREKGYEPGVYIYQYTGYYAYELIRLTDYMLWCASIGDYPFFYYAHDIWQYDIEGTVPGIDTVCDLNMMFIKRAVAK